jgi:hypothetical protein
MGSLLAFIEKSNVARSVCLHASLVKFDDWWYNENVTACSATSRLLVTVGGRALRVMLTADVSRFCILQDRIGKWNERRGYTINPPSSLHSGWLLAALCDSPPLPTATPPPLSIHNSLAAASDPLPRPATTCDPLPRPATNNDQRWIRTSAIRWELTTATWST